MIHNTLFAQKLRLLATVAPMSLLMATTPAFAQGQAAPAAGAQAVPAAEVIPEDTNDTDVVVTGSRISRPGLESTVPIASLKGADIYTQANPNVGEVLNNLPQLRSTFAQQNPGLGIGIAGLNLLDLRGLGVERTLVLVNGRRHVPSDLQNSAAAVDINTIPTDLIDRIDIVTGGNSAVYGSDAIAGVVNFVLKDSFEGIQARAGVTIPEYGAGGNRYISAVAGKNFGDGRGNIAAAVEYSLQDRLFASNIPWLRAQDAFITRDADGTGAAFPNGSDGIFDTVLTHDVRSSTIARYGLIPIIQTRNAAAPCGTGIASGSNVRTNYSCNLIFDSLGNLRPQTGDRAGLGPTGSFIGGNGDSGREDHLLSVMPYNERIAANVIGHYTFSDAATFFAEGSYARVHTVGSNSGPAFNQGFNQTFADPRANYRIDNPFLNAAARTLITNSIIASGSNTGLTSGSQLTPANIANLANGSYRFVVARNFSDLGIRDEDAIRETYRFVAGVRGEVSPHVSYELSGNYGRTNEKITILGNVNVQRLLLAQDAGIDPANPGLGIQCRSKFDPAARGSVADVDGDGTIAADIAACVPYNAFGGSDNTAARNYIVSNSGDRGHLSQTDVTGFISADSGGFFNLPGGPVALVLGGEWRREDAKFKADPDIEAGLTFLNALQTFDPPALEVVEGFGELNIPLLKDLPFIRSLSLSGAGRVSHYNKAYGSTGTVWAWNFGGEWSPVSDIRFRANYGKSVRAPNYTDTAGVLAQNFAPGFADPCNSSRLGAGTPTRTANCQSVLGQLSNPTALINNPDFAGKTNGTYSLEILSGSNPDLKAETSRSLTVGAVFTPRFLPGFDVTVDYYDINVHGVISAPTAQQIVNSCYDLPDLNNQYCPLFSRNLTNTPGPDGEAPGEILVQSLAQFPLNYASRRRRGIDVQVNYNHALSSSTRLNVRGYYTHQLSNSNYIDPARPGLETRLLGQLGDPKNEVVFNADLTIKQVTIGYGAHYIGPMLTTPYANLYSINGNPPQNADIINIIRYPSVLYHDLRVSVQIGATTTTHKGFEWFVGVHNVGDKHPPLGSTATGAGSAIYDVLGRSFFSGVRATF